MTDVIRYPMGSGMPSPSLRPCAMIAPSGREFRKRHARRRRLPLPYRTDFGAERLPSFHAAKNSEEPEILVGVHAARRSGLGHLWRMQAGPRHVPCDLGEADACGEHDASEIHARPVGSGIRDELTDRFRMAHYQIDDGAGIMVWIYDTKTIAYDDRHINGWCFCSYCIRHIISSSC